MDKQVIEKGSRLGNEGCIGLRAQIREEEYIVQKAPGIDGMNSLFFKYNWPVMKNDIVKSII